MVSPSLLVAVSSLLLQLHYCGAFSVASSLLQCCPYHCSIALAITLLWCHCCSHIVAVIVSWVNLALGLLIISYIRKPNTWPLLAFPGGGHFNLALRSTFFLTSQFISYVTKKMNNSAIVKERTWAEVEVEVGMCYDL